MEAGNKEFEAAYDALRQHFDRLLQLKAASLWNEITDLKRRMELLEAKK